MHVCLDVYVGVCSVCVFVCMCQSVTCAKKGLLCMKLMKQLVSNEKNAIPYFLCNTVVLFHDNIYSVFNVYIKFIFLDSEANFKELSSFVFLCCAVKPSNNLYQCIHSITTYYLMICRSTLGSLNTFFY